MTKQPHYTLPPDWLALIAQQEWEVLPQLLTLVINAAMRAEREQHLRAAPYERSPDRRGYANGFKPKTVQTRLGELTFAVPQVRGGSFYPPAPEKGLRSERALRLAEMYVQGVSTRKVSAVTEELESVPRCPDTKVGV